MNEESDNDMELSEQVRELERKIAVLNKSTENLIKEFKDFICYHQKTITESSIKMAYAVDLILNTEDEKDLEKKVVKFYNKTQEGITNLCKKCIPPINSYFQLDNRHHPRVTIKLLSQNRQGAQDKSIIDYFRGDRNSYLGYAFKADQNTGFDEINRGEKFYCSNNIPDDAKSNRYNNSRLIKKNLDKYSIPTSFEQRMKNIPHNQIKRDLEWEKCWISYENLINNNRRNRAKPSVRSCYKSTLIVPIILSEIDTDTKRNLCIDDEYDSAIFGYICFDDTCIEYFNIYQDLNIGYIFSDILSLYIVEFYYFEQRILEKLSFLNEKCGCWKEKICRSDLISRS